MELSTSPSAVFPPCFVRLPYISLLSISAPLRPRIDYMTPFPWPHQRHNGRGLFYWIPNSQSALTLWTIQIAFKYRRGSSFFPFSYLFHCLWSMPILSPASFCVIPIVCLKCFKLTNSSIVISFSVLAFSTNFKLQQNCCIDKRQMCSNMVLTTDL